MKQSEKQMTNEGYFRVVSPSEIRDGLSVVRVGPVHYFVPTDELDKVLNHGGSPSYALAIRPCKRA